MKRVKNYKIKKFTYLVFFISFFVFIPYCIVNYSNFLGDNNSQVEGNYFVTSVVDGDTIIIKKDGKNKFVRLIGIDAPEVRSEYRKRDECFGSEAKKFLKEKVEGKYVRMESDVLVPERDRYGRLLRYIYFNETLINEVLIRKGYAYFVQYKEHQFSKNFLIIEQQAQEKDRGLWRVCN